LGADPEVLGKTFKKVTNHSMLGYGFIEIDGKIPTLKNFDQDLLHA
jgi:hypothetical protein